MMMNEDHKISTEEINQLDDESAMTIREFKRFLYSFKTDSKSFKTHVGMDDMIGCFQFNRKGLEDLFNILGANKDDKLNLHLLELPQHYSMFRLDIDRKIVGDEPKKLFTDDEILKIVKQVQSILKSNISNDVFKSHLVDCVLLEKPPYIKGDKISNGFHLQFPNSNF